MFLAGVKNNRLSPGRSHMDESEPVNYRKFSDNDLGSCRNLWEQLTIAHRAIYDNPSIGGPDPGKFFDEHLEKIGTENIWIAEMDGQVKGLMGLEIGEDEITIEPLVISQSQRGKGIGRGFMEIAIQEAKNRNATFLSVKPVARNLSALRFFSMNGMTTVGHVELFMDLKNREWKDGLRLHDMDFKY